MNPAVFVYFAEIEFKEKKKLPKIKDEIGDDKDVVWGEVNPMMKSVEKSLSGA